MAGLIPRRKRADAANNGGNGGTLTSVQDFPMLMRRIQTEFDELFNRFAQDLPAPWKDFNIGWDWALDVDDKDDSIVVRAEAPGFEAGDFDIQVSDNRLILRASREQKSEQKEGDYREQRECYESINLPSGIDTDKIDACYHSGVLTLTIPKTAAGKSKKIAVKAS